MKFSIFVSVLFLVPSLTFAQMKFRSVDTAKPIEFTFGFQHAKAAFVWYKGQNEPIALKLKKLEIDSSERASGQPDFYSYTYTEVYKGKITGEYGITEWPRNVDDIYYIRFKDGKKFTFKLVEDDEFYDGKSMVLLKNVRIYFNAFYNDNLTLTYPDGTSAKYTLNHLDKNQARRVEIKDYNFDGIDDIAFETASSNMNHSYDVFIYGPVHKKFSRLSEPSTGGCGRLQNLKLDPVNKTLVTKCKSGAKWNSYSYKFNQSGKLTLIKKD